MRICSLIKAAVVLILFVPPVDAQTTRDTAMVHLGAFLDSTNTSTLEFKAKLKHFYIEFEKLYEMYLVHCYNDSTHMEVGGSYDIIKKWFHRPPSYADFVRWVMDKPIRTQ